MQVQAKKKWGDYDLKRTKLLFICVLSLIIGWLLIADSKGTADTVRRCISVCLDSLIPSLFCFMAFSALLIKSGIGEYITSPLWYIFRYILRIDKRLFPVFILSQIGGYPIGVKLLSEISQQQTEYSKQCSNALCYCYNSGPAFVIGIVGIGVYGDINAGLIVFLSCLAANTLAAVVMNIRSSPQKTAVTNISLSAENITDSLIGTAKAMLNIALPILLFNSVAEISAYICQTIFSIDIPDILLSVIEITNIKASDTVFSLPVATALISFGGLCVIYQIFTLSSFKANKLQFVLSRLIISIVSAVICHIIISVTGYTPTQNVFSYATDTLISDPLLLICIAGMTFILLKDTGKTNKI